MTVHILAAKQMNADTAGFTGGADGDGNYGQPAPPTISEAFHGVDSIFSGGLHPEHVPAIVDHGLERASDSIRGRLGGLRPAVGSVLAPGPAGGSAAARAMLSGALRRLESAFKTPANPEG